MKKYLSRAVIILVLIAVAGLAVKTYLLPSNEIESGGEKSYQISEKSKIQVNQKDWDKTRFELNKCVAEKDADKLTFELLAKEQYLKGFAECSSNEQGSNEVIVEEAQQKYSRVITELNYRLSKYQASYAVVSGWCRAKMNDGDRRKIRLDQTCLSISHKNVDNDGEIVAIVSAMSVEAQRNEIASLDCYVGESSIKIQRDSCLD